MWKDLVILLLALATGIFGVFNVFMNWMPTIYPVAITTLLLAVDGFKYWKQNKDSY